MTITLTDKEYKTLRYALTTATQYAIRDPHPDGDYINDMLNLYDKIVLQKILKGEQE